MFREEYLYMPNNPSAEKRMRQEQKRRTHNRMVKSIVKTSVTKARQAITSGVDSEEAVRAAVSELDRAAKKGVIHRNNASRRKSRLMKQLNKTTAQAK
jgi:small subunit ribosomal protein S20